MQVQHWLPGLIVHTTVKYGPIRLLEFTWWILLVILYKMKLPPYFGVYRLAVGFSCGYSNDPIDRPSESLDRVPDTDLPPYSASPIDLGISPWEKYIAYSTNPCMVVSIERKGSFKPYLRNLWQCRNPLELTYVIKENPPLLLVSLIGAACGQIWSIKNCIFSQR